MNRYQLANSAGRIIAAVSVDEANVLGQGGAAYPRSLFPTFFESYKVPFPGPDYVFRELTGQLFRGPGDKLADSLAVRLFRIQRAHWEYGYQLQVLLEFPLNHKLLSQLE